MVDIKHPDILVNRYFPQDYLDFQKDEDANVRDWLRNSVYTGLKVEVAGIAPYLAERTVLLANGKTEKRQTTLEMEVRGTVETVIVIEDDDQPYGTALYIILTDGTIIKRDRAASRQNVKKYALKEGESYVRKA